MMLFVVAILFNCIWIQSKLIGLKLKLVVTTYVLLISHWVYIAGRYLNSIKIHSSSFPAGRFIWASKNNSSRFIWADKIIYLGRLSAQINISSDQLRLWDKITCHIKWPEFLICPDKFFHPPRLIDLPGNALVLNIYYIPLMKTFTDR